MRFTLLLFALGLLAPPAFSEEKVDEEVVKAVRAALNAKRSDEREDLIAKVLEREDLDLASVKKGLAAGRYYQKPMVTGFKTRHSSKHFDLVFSGHDGKPRGFSLYLPTSYDAETPVPVLLYLHHSPGVEQLGQGKDLAGVALLKFRDMCEKHGILFLVPYTCRGAEWWTPEGKRLVDWSLRQVRRIYNIDDNRVGLMGALGGADSVWYLGQEMPGTWSVLMPMTGDPYEIAAMIRPLFLGTLDRMDVLMGVPGKTRSAIGEKDANQFLDGLKPFFGQRMRITTAIYPTSQGDFHYLEKITEQVAAFLLAHKREPFAKEVDVETEAESPLQSLWLRNDGYDPDGDVPPAYVRDFKSTLLKWTPPAPGKGAAKKIGVELRARPGWEIGMVIASTPGEAKHSRIYPRDVILEADGVPVRKAEDLKGVLENKEWESEVRLLLAREVAADMIEKEKKKDARYRKVRRQIEELRAAGKPVPKDIWETQEEEEDGAPAEEEEEEEESDEIVISGDDDPKEKKKPAGNAGGGGKRGRKKTEIFVIERWVKLRRPAGPLVRKDFGAAYDHTFDKEGIRIGNVYTGSPSWRAGLRKGDVIVQIGDTEVRKVHDLEDWFKEWKFEKEPEGERFVEMTVKRQQGQGGGWEDRTIRLEWNPVVSSRVDAVWNRQEKTMEVLARHASGFTLFFNDELIPAGEEFHLFINGVPYQDLVDPANTPDYPHVRHGSAAEEGDRLYRMRRKRAKVEGWKPDLKFTLENFMETWDRQLILCGSRSFDLTKMKAGFEQARTRHTGRRGKLGGRIKAAYEEHRGAAAPPGDVKKPEDAQK